MNKKICFILMLVSVTFLVKGQSVIDSSSQKIVKDFYIRIDNWADSTIESTRNKSQMVNDFILFSEDGLLMKDFDFHDVTSCEKRILESLPKTDSNTPNRNWIYVAAESVVNESDLSQVLFFLFKNKIEYEFGSDEIISRLFMKN